ncbi:zincin-like metallopeptidase domain-containing protein, partial [Neisseria gonorrhoeae]|uniref:zincin-like metallopeptidase domain-containing protein n=1 Tax=Neisseria gonorrhoeae TaxID=485 RepID=UPI003F74A910
MKLRPLSWNPDERAENILKNSGAVIDHRHGDRAFYSPSRDSITLPLREQFESPGAYYETALHELGHWTGHADRLNRDLSHPFGSEGYAREELRAEIASLMLSQELGVSFNPGQHASYVASWIMVLQDDPMEIMRAASDAEKIQGYVMAFDQVREIEQQNEAAVSISDRQNIDEASLAEE